MYVLGGAICGLRFCRDTAAFRNPVAIPICITNCVPLTLNNTPNPYRTLTQTPNINSAVTPTRLWVDRAGLHAPLQLTS